MGVVDPLEIIDIQQLERQRRGVLTGQVEFTPGTVEEMPAIAALRQHIGGSQALQLAFELLLLGDVFRDADDRRASAIFALTRDEALVAEPAQLPIAADDAVLAPFHGAFFEHLAQRLLGILEVIGVDAVAPFIEVAEQQRGGTPEDLLVGGADIDHLLVLPVERPEHGVHASQQGTEQLFALAQTRHFAARMHQRQQGLRLARRHYRRAVAHVLAVLQ